MEEKNLEFNVSNESLALIKGASIDANFQQVKDWLTSAMADYANLVIVEDDIANAKNVRAEIRKVSDAIDSQRKTVKKLWNEPYTAFEQKCKELVAICDKASGNLDGQIKSFENKAKEEKLARLKAFWNENCGESGMYATFEAIQNPKWANTGFKEEAAQEEISRTIAQIAEDIDTIRGMDSEFYASLVDEYSKSRDLRAVLQLQKTLEARKAAEEARRAREAIKSEIIAPKVENAPQVANIASDTKLEQKASAQPESKSAKIYTLVFQVSGTVHQMNQLKAAFDDIGIEYFKL